MTDMTIKAIRTTLLRMPWPDTPWLKGHAFGEARTLPGARGRDQGRHRRHGLSVRVPARTAHHRRVSRGNHRAARARQGCDGSRGDLAGSLARHHDLRPRRHRHDGDVGARHRAVGCGRQARQPAAAPAVGAFPLAAAGLWQRLLPRLRRRRDDRQGAALQAAGLQGDQDAGRARGQPAHRSRQCAAHARGGRPGDRHHDRRQYGLDRRRRHPDGPQVRGLRHLLAGGAGGGRRFQGLHADRRSARSAHRRRRDAFHPLRPAAVLRESAACRSCSPIRCAAASPICARSRPSPTPGA